MKNYKSRRKKYKLHKLHAKQRNIPWDFNYCQWIKIWLKSGHWYERGKKPGQYQMARYGDTGPYSPNNVRIITVGDNVREAHLGRKYSQETCDRMSKSRIGNKNRLGKKHTPETKAKISAAKKGWKPTKATRLKYSNAQKARWRKRKAQGKLGPLGT